MTTPVLESRYTTCICIKCGKNWPRPVGAGRPPKYCDGCAGRNRPTPNAMPKKKPPVDEIPARDHHNKLDTLMAVAKARIPVMCVGPAGSGKTTAARTVAERMALPFKAKPCNPQMSEWDIYGYTAVDGVTFKPGIVYDAFKNGGVVLLDEIDASNPAVLVAINIVASARIGEAVTFPNGENVPRHKDFILIAGANTFGDGASDEYVGREQLDAATLDRFAVVDWQYDELLEFTAAGRDKIGIDWTKFVQRVRKAATNARVEFLVTPRASINGAALLRDGMDRKTVEALTVWKGISPDALNAIRKELEKLEAEEKRKQDQQRREQAEQDFSEQGEPKPEDSPTPGDGGDQKGDNEQGGKGSDPTEMNVDEAVKQMRSQLAKAQAMQAAAEATRNAFDATLFKNNMRLHADEFRWNNRTKSMQRVKGK